MNDSLSSPKPGTVRQTLDYSVWIAVALLVAVLLVNAGLGHRNTRQLHEYAREVAHTQEVLALSGDTLGALVDAETGMRGFVITGKNEFLQDYEAALPTFGRLFRKLKDETKDSPAQQARLQKLEEMASLKLGFLQEAIALRHQSAEDATALIATGKDKAQMDAIRLLVQGLEQVETDLLRDQQRANARAYGVAVTTVLLAAAFGLVLVGAFVLLLHRSQRARGKAAAALLVSEERFRLAAQVAGLAVAEIDYATDQVHLSPESAALFGLPPQPLVVSRASIHALFHPVDRLALEELIAASHDPAGTGEFAVDHRIVRPDSQVRWHSVRKQIFFEQGRPVRALLALFDITERKRAEKALRENAALFSTLIAQAPMGTYVVDAQFRMRQINAEAMPAFGSVHPLIGRDFQEIHEILWGPDLGGQIADIFRHTLATGERYVSPPFTHPRQDLGIEQSYEWETQRVTLPDGQHGVVCYFHEVTERAQATAALRANQERVRLAAEATGVGIWEWNVLTNAIHWDGSMFRMYGIEPTPDGLVHYPDWSGAVLPEDMAETEAILQDTVRRCGQSTREFRIRRRSDGEVRWIQAVETVRPNHDGKAQWVLGTNLDVTERVASAEALRVADRRKDEFLATLAHELRNPLAPVRNGLQILRRTKDPAIAQRTQAVMERQLGQMVRLIDDLLEVSRISSGKVVLRPERLELQSAVHSAIEAARPHIDAARHVLHLEITPEPLWLQADATRICQVVNNLLTNAAKYSPDGSTIRMSVHREGDEAVVTVADDGEGIPQNMLGEVFEMFTQIDSTLDRAQGGLGIGLALVRRLVDLHGGTVTAQSAGLGAGSTFTVRLPTLVDAAAAAVAADSNLALLDEAVTATRLRVLVVDDNVDAAESLAELLSIDGHECRVADSGASALAIVREFKPALILLDIGMPGMNGYETARRIRAEDSSGQVSLAALTGWGAEADRLKAMEAGFDHHFTKPVEPAKVNDVLRLVALRQAKLATASSAF